MKTTFEKIHVGGFRRLQDISIDLNPLNVMIGANGSGKTSVLDVFSLLAASASGDLKETMSSLGGVNANITALEAPRHRDDRLIKFNLDKAVQGHAPLKYSLSLRPAGLAYDILGESLLQHN